MRFNGLDLHDLVPSDYGIFTPPFAGSVHHTLWLLVSRVRQRKRRPFLSHVTVAPYGSRAVLGSFGPFWRPVRCPGLVKTHSWKDSNGESDHFQTATVGWVDIFSLASEPPKLLGTPT